MDEDEENPVRTKGSCSPESSDKRSGDEVDWVRDLPESLLLHVLLNLPTKDVVKSSVLSSKWRNLWRYVPGLELDCRDFTEFNALVSFINSFLLSFNRETCLTKFKLRCDSGLDGDTLVWRWINVVIKRKIQHLDVTWPVVEIPRTLYKCESLVSLKLSEVTLPKTDFVSLPLLSSRKLNVMQKVDIDIEFNFCRGKKFDPDDLSKREMIGNFFVGISGVKKMTIAACTLEVIYDYSRCEPMPLFPNLSFLSVDFYDRRWKILPFFLESCPNLKSLVVESTYFPKKRTSILSQPRRLLSSLEYVKIELSLDKRGMKLVRYLLENSPILKKLTLSLDNCSRKKSVIILKKLLKIPRRSSSCQVIVL
ncbi:F-box-like domain superfamily [Arabidopsis thaliana x Arabidopsis arenosa]|uniref:F-box-like domain superfamily n=1 Tax=Arabidopsis thaliana x Arabidopsis arenosa TaxID=1240361 RepID=A0A8T1YD53_9BRAS|nr:F-box-like domain superfamily [Arabidopsis thaliana x Arabidopsis arenosa]